MPDSEDVVREARSWIGTPYNHMECKKGIAVDCVGLIKGVGLNLGYFTNNKGYPHTYSRFPNGFSLKDACDEYLDEISPSANVVGSVVLFWLENPVLPTHLGIVSLIGGRFGLIHASSKAKKVIEHSFDEPLVSKVVSFYTFKN